MSESLVELLAPRIFHQEVPLQDRLDHEVVLLVPLLKQRLLHNRQLSLIDANEA